MEEDIKLGKDLHEFEEIFGNVPIKDLEKIREYIKRDYIPKSKVREKIEIRYRQAKGLYEQGVLPRPQYTMKLLTELKKELLQEGDDKIGI